MEPRVLPISQLMAVSSRLFRRALAGADHETLRRRPLPDSNPMHWIAGHATVVRARFAAGLGRPYELPWAVLFRRGGTNDAEAEWPSIETILAAWDEVDAVLQQRLSELTADDLAAASPPGVGFDGTMNGLIQLMAFHDAYHVGQLGYLRRMSGLERLVG